jgi:hypothetical protein
MRELYKARMRASTRENETVVRVRESRQVKDLVLICTGARLAGAQDGPTTWLAPLHFTRLHLHPPPPPAHLAEGVPLEEHEATAELGAAGLGHLGLPASSAPLLRRRRGPRLPVARVEDARLHRRVQTDHQTAVQVRIFGSLRQELFRQGLS